MALHVLFYFSAKCLHVVSYGCRFFLTNANPAANSNKTLAVNGVNRQQHFGSCSNLVRTLDIERIAPVTAALKVAEVREAEGPPAALIEPPVTSFECSSSKSSKSEPLSA